MTANMARKQRARVNRGERVDPTPETIARLVPDAALEMYRRGCLTDDMLLAIEELRELVTAMRRQHIVMKPDAVAAAGASAPDPVTRLSPRLYHIWRTRWVPWSERMRHEPLKQVSTYKQASCFAATMALVEDNVWPHEAYVHTVRLFPDVYVSRIVRALDAYVRLTALTVRLGYGPDASTRTPRTLTRTPS